MILHLNGSAMTQWARDDTDRRVHGSNAVISTLNPWAEQEGLPQYYVNARENVPRPNPDSLLVVDDERIAAMYGQQRMDTSAVETLAAMPGIEVADIGPDSPKQWRDRAAAVYPNGQVHIAKAVGAHGQTVISVSVPDGVAPVGQVAFLREVDGKRIALFVLDRQTFEEIYGAYRQHYGHEPKLLPPGNFMPVINPEVYQSWNPIFVILLTPLVVAFFGWRIRSGSPMPTAHKLVWGMILTTGALLLMTGAGLTSNGGVMKVSGLWLASFYMMVTLGELFLSPMGLSLVTKLSPKRLVGLTMGGWFLATAFGNNLSGFFGGIQQTMSPVTFFLLLAGLAGLVVVFLLLVLPRLDTAIKQYGA